MKIFHPTSCLLYGIALIANLVPVSGTKATPPTPACSNEIIGFTLIDPDTDAEIGPLGDYDESAYPSGVNIRADYSPCSTADFIDSVRVTFDDPSVSFCELETPYSVFRDSPEGDYRAVVIPVGVHTVSATPYLSADCSSDAGATFSQTFEVTAIAGRCVTGFKLYDSVMDSVVADSILTGGEIMEGSVIRSGRPCKLNIEAVADGCPGFDIVSVRLQLRDATTNAGIKGRRENDAPYMLYGDKDGDIRNGSVPAGKYRIRAAAILDGESSYQDYYEIDFEFDACAGGSTRSLRGNADAK
ncbi:predicted protein [Phaeodactylum tricornutum CCAP 1055/1]|jgi:hypothetical protein|uniref:Uncharacterized protein n=1 Tax=Phaeodactylum tricornutum (strain CCAP 1055/1) TaxID=556484 RepID=B7S3R1_PHATC|nr:predicted protein [Phaeodactylum tricornutum CCAP 1055/1]EEC42811.1 predicted protein [Phaeodactylum tricornutum CCAP 1055/1]|eukprot:XP_002176201.1 predicted protein [Phaeodactylum tricornutum CCAP 1055/1]